MSLKEIWKSPAIHSPHPKDTVIEKITRHFAYWVQFVLDYDQRIRAASLAYFTFFGLVPFWSVFLWFTYSLRTDANLSTQLGEIFPGMKDSFDFISIMAENNLNNLSSTWTPWIALGIIVYTVFCMFDNIQRIFNEIWKSTQRKMMMRVRTSVISFLVLSSVILLTSYCFRNINSLAINAVIFTILLFACLSAAFYFFPFDKKPATEPILVSAALTTFLLLLWVLLIPVIVKYVAIYQSVGLLSFLIIFWIFVTWLIIVFGAKFCRNRDKSGETYLKEEIENLATLYRCYMSMIVTSYIFKNTVKNTTGTYSLSFEQIRNEMFKTEDGDGENAFLPMPLLDQIIDELCERLHLLIRKTNFTNGVKYCPNKSMKQIETYTVGDFLYDYFVAGGNLSTFQYEKLLGSLEIELAGGFSKLFASQDRLLIDLNPDLKAIGRKEIKNGMTPSEVYSDERRKLYDDFK